MTILSSSSLTATTTPSSKKKTQQGSRLLKEKATPSSVVRTSNNSSSQNKSATTPNHSHSIHYQIGGSFNSRPLLLDDENIFCVPLSQNIAVYSNSTGKHIHTITFHKKKVTQIIRDDNNECSLFSVSEDGYLCHWNIMIEKNQSQLLKQVNIGKPIYGIQQDKTNSQILYLCVLDHFYSFIKLNLETCSEHDRTMIQTSGMTNTTTTMNGTTTNSTTMNGTTTTHTTTTMNGTTTNTTTTTTNTSYLLQMYQFTQMNISKTHLFAIGGVDLYIYNLKKQELETTQTNEGIPLTAMAFCEELEILATADARGVISLWFSDGTRSSHHWHPSIVTCLQFSEEGDYLYSSGIEGVVVCWRLPSQKKDKFLVTDTAIQQFTLSSSQDVILVLGKDNIIRKYEFARFALLYRVFGMNTNLDQKQVDQIQVTLEPHSSNILVSGTDSLQWYNINDGSVKHYECVQFRDVKYDPSRFQETLPVRTVIEHIAYSSDAQFMAHVESFGSWKQNLKFWKCSKKSNINPMHMIHDSSLTSTNTANTTTNTSTTVNTSTDTHTSTSITTTTTTTNTTTHSSVDHRSKPQLVTVIDSPHQERITHLQFVPCGGHETLDHRHTCLTSSLDGKIRIWKLSMNTQLFSCSAIIEYKNLSATSFDISSDGTLLIACFGCEITLWDLQTLELIESFSYPYHLTDCKFVTDDSIAVISDRYISLFSIAFESKNVWSIDAGHVEGLVSNGCGKFAVIVNGSDICQFDVLLSKMSNSTITTTDRDTHRSSSSSGNTTNNHNNMEDDTSPMAVTSGMKCTLPPLEMHLETDHFVNALFYKKSTTTTTTHSPHELYFLNKQFEVYRVMDTTTTTNFGHAIDSTTTTTTSTNTANTNTTAITTKSTRMDPQQEDTNSSVYEKKWSSKETHNNIALSLMDLQKVITSPFSTEKGNKAWKEIFNAPSHSLISMSSCYSTFMNSFVLRAMANHNEKQNDLHTQLSENDQNRSAHYATSVSHDSDSRLTSPTTTTTTTTLISHSTRPSSKNVSSHHDSHSSLLQDHVELPSADLIRFLKSYHAHNNKQ
ncbi:hypothetical protein C9374_006177 [Naegleria lovaniensis]|uniref:WD repeat-containing protein 75 second beta-propeller domain-containing protein n=1 Tax=Naegleria lovaniensis TaxID=51637 RepID=A0AA88GPI5_NAELO|nr:uncharacterized protein C9374_006177 [Naegleria lovaniensis]KAG2381793.1 hypothetical protein C9374_006177 [Naegleria lovaniensis]